VNFNRRHKRVGAHLVQNRSIVVEAEPYLLEQCPSPGDNAISCRLSSGEGRGLPHILTLSSVLEE